MSWDELADSPTDLRVVAKAFDPEVVHLKPQPGLKGASLLQDAPHVSGTGWPRSRNRGPAAARKPMNGFSTARTPSALATPSRR